MTVSVMITPCRLRRDSATAPITQANVRLAVLLSVPGLGQDMDLYEATSGNDKDGNWRNCKLIETQADTRLGRSFDETEACGACSCFSIMMMYRVCVSIVITVYAMQERAAKRRKEINDKPLPHVKFLVPLHYQVIKK